MSHFTPVLYGNRLFGQVLYNINEDFETFSVSLSDSTTLVDTGLADTLIKALSELLTAADATITTAGTKSLADSSTITDAIAKSLATHFADTLISSDAKTISAVKSFGLASTPWNTPLFGSTLFGQNLFGYVPVTALETVHLADMLVTTGVKPLADSTTLADQIAKLAQIAIADALTILEGAGAIPPIVIQATKVLTDFILLKEWITITLKRADPWAISPVTTKVVPLFGPTLFGQVLFGYTPSIVWSNPRTANSWTTANPTYPSFTNNDGESHQG